MATYVGSARQDERGKYSGGARGDQTGKEVSYQPWYLHSKGWYVLRAKDPSVRKRLAYAMKAACDNNNIGYSQSDRNSLYNAVLGKGFDPAKCTVKANTDCSALVRVCVCYALGKSVPDFNTSSELSTLKNLGVFDQLDSKYISSEYIEAGDIHITKTKGHTVIAITSGSKVASSSTSSVSSNSSSNNDIKTLQQNLNKILGTNLSVDGIVGPATKEAVKTFQKRYDLSVDGIAGPATKAKINEVLSGNSSNSSSKVANPLIKYGYKGSNAKLLQQNLNQVLGLRLDVDGIFGSKSVEALKTFQKKYGLSVDGIYGQRSYNKMKSLI